MIEHTENRWIVYYIDGTEICDCDNRHDAIREMEARAKRFPGEYVLTENSDRGSTEIAEETFIFSATQGSGASEEMTITKEQ